MPYSERNLMNTDQNDTITALITQQLEKIDQGIVPYDTNEVLKIKAALDANKPTADFILQTIHNELRFLAYVYEAQDDTEFQSIKKFIESFQEFVKTELLSTSGTFTEGLKMQIAE